MDIEEGRIVPGEIHDKCVCSEHFSDKELQGIIKQEGHGGQCSYCGGRRIVMDMPDFVKMVRDKIESEFEDVDNACFHWRELCLMMLMMLCPTL